MTDVFEKQIDFLIEKHMPVAFVDYDFLQRLKSVLSHRDCIGRKEILIIAYLIGANADESNKLLQMLGYPPLYVKRREDAIWRFVLNHHLDSTAIIHEIFPQNADEKTEEN